MAVLNLRDCIDELTPEQVQVVEDEEEYDKILFDLLTAGVVLKKNESGKNLLLSVEKAIQAYPGKKYFLLYTDVETVETLSC
ncbi:MAG: hypothetical protein IKF38_05510 [Clostridia bacterium]|nr:hypothetical protein [Clostridia bacterium]